MCKVISRFSMRLTYNVCSLLLNCYTLCRMVTSVSSSVILWRMLVASNCRTFGLRKQISVQRYKDYLPYHCIPQGYPLSNGGVSFGNTASVPLL